MIKGLFLNLRVHLKQLFFKNSFKTVIVDFLIFNIVSTLDPYFYEFGSLVQILRPSPPLETVLNHITVLLQLKYLVITQDKV